MLATLNIVTNPFHPTLDRVQKPIQRKVKVNTLVNKHKIDLNKPVICYYNGQPLLRKAWSQTVVKNGDVVVFVYLPQGGGGSNPLKLALMLAVTIYAPHLAAGILGKIGIAAEGFALAATTAGIALAGNVLVNALIPPPAPPKNQTANSMAAPSPTYSIGAQGNSARIGQAIPVVYGKMKVYPDFAAQPYAEYANNQQYLYQLFVLSQGVATVNVADVFVEDSPIDSFGDDYEIEILQPGQASTLYPTNVYNASEVNGQELTGGGGSTIGPFTVNPTTTRINKVAFDIVAPKGIYYLNDDGGFDTRSMSVRFYAQEIDDAGADVGSQFVLGDRTIQGATSTAIRKTFRFNVPEGRYKLSAYRLAPKDEDSRVANDMNWAGARGYSSETVDYGNVTLMALKLRATNTISSQSSRKINCIVRRLLQIPSYNEAIDGFNWSGETETQSIAWAIADMCRAQYGANVTEARFDVNELIALDQIWTSRGDKLNCVFDSSQTFWEALTMACRAGRARPYVQGGMIHFVRDQLQTLPTAMFTSRNMVKDTFKISYIMPSEDTADCIDVEYFDETIWKPRTVRAQLDVGTPTKPAKIKAFGVTNRDQAFREGMNIAASNRYRRKEISFETELEGHIPALGDLIGIQSDIPEWGQHGEAVAVTISGDDTIVRSSEPLTWTESAVHYVMLRRADGSACGPIECFQTANEYEFSVKSEDLDFDIYTGFEKEKTHISFGRSGQVIQLARLLSATPRDRTVLITAINEDARVHSADGTPTPIDTYEWAINTPKIRPILTDFNVVQTGSGTTPTVTLSWEPTPGAGKFVIEKSTDNENWETIAEVSSTSHSFLANIGTVYIRMAAFGGVIGPYITKTVAIGQIPPPADVSSGAINANGQAFDVRWTPVADCDGYYVEVLYSGALKRSFNTTSTNFIYTVENGYSDGGPWRTIDVKIKARKGEVLSQTALTLNGSNPAPAAPTMVVVPGNKTISVTVSQCDDTDYAGTVIHASTSAVFTPSEGNKVYEGRGTFVLLDATQTMYFKSAHYDTYGKTSLNYSATYSATPITNIGGIARVSSLPVSGMTEGDVVYLTTDDKLYRYDGTAWVTSVSAADISGQISSGQIANGAITQSKFGTGIEPIGIVSSLPNPSGYTGVKTVLLTSDNKLYRYTGTAWTSATPAADISGQLTNAQIADVAAAKVTGQITDAQIAAVATSKLSGQVQSAQIQDLVATKITGTIATSQIADNAISTAKIAAGAVSVEKTKTKRHMIY